MLAAVRATHEHLDLGVLDVLTRDAADLPEAIESLNGDAGPLDGWVVMSTCNRLEVYLDTQRFHDGLDLVVEAVSETSGLDPELVSVCFETAMGAPVAEHLYEVTAGLRSVVLGEAEIAGQVRAAFDAARGAGHTTAQLNDLFQIGFRFAKRVASRTPVGAAGRSGVAIALDHAIGLIGPLQDKDVLVIGTGAYARLGVADLTRRGAVRVRVHSGSGRAIGFAERHGVEPIRAEELGSAIREADLVLACSGRGTSLFPDHFRDVGPTLILDLALHSDLHPLVRHRGGVRVLDLSDLTIEIDEEAAPVLEAARRIIADGVAQFTARQEYRRVDPAMAALRRSLGEATDAEVARLRRTGKTDEAEDVERSIRRILAKVMHSPTARARELAEQGDAEKFVQAFHTIFGVDLGEADAPAEGDHLASAWVRLDRTVPPEAVREGELTAADAASAAEVAGLALEGDLPAVTASSAEVRDAEGSPSVDTAPSADTMQALARLARIGVQENVRQDPSACPLTPAQQQAFLAQVGPGHVDHGQAGHGPMGRGRV
ncbi:glutamyl-tRNA reductase [Brachybacterium endophyticum]|uniref:Glutamyl-tRNA reductase n=1 Tax=Brachybacterium endophyticum TaxID=2182385 RepID=A0A2U2RKQ3_9MICO|nr:glutamyl-tRNA reductase [Brachybacterium endophyticum]PWH06416.1 glutamyl-tRNA reductase [Brachybacterium endophyticum]